MTDSLVDAMVDWWKRGGVAGSMGMKPIDQQMGENQGLVDALRASGAPMSEQIKATADNPMANAFSPGNIGGAFAGIFAGKGAKTADLLKQAMAEKMAAAGADRGEILKQTGWFQGPDKQWRFEVDDSPSVVDGAALRPTGRIPRAEEYLRTQGVDRPNPIGNPSVPQNLQSEALAFADQTANSRGTIPASSYLVHDDLYKAYPALAHTPVGQQSGAALRGSYDPNVNIIRTGGGTIADRAGARDSTVLHEMQHSIQDKEGFALGGSPSGPYLSGERMNFIEQQYNDLKRLSAYDPANPYSLKEPQLSDRELYDQAVRFVDSEDGRMAFYKRLAGEAEARNVQKRMTMTADQRAATPPWQTLDVPERELIVRALKGLK